MQPKIYIAFFIDSDDFYAHPEIRVYVGTNRTEAINCLRANTPKRFRDDMHIETWENGNHIGDDCYDSTIISESEVFGDAT